MIFALASLLLSIPQDPGTEPDGNKLVQVELVSERAKLHPGEHFTLAAKLTVTPRWHIYWGENPGETGAPTRLEIEAPKEFVIGAPQFPVPARHVDPGPIESFVHEGQVLVLFDAVAPAKLEPGAKVRFELAASWLVCTSRCFQGEGEAALELECADKGEPAPANEALFQSARAKLPRKLADLKGFETKVLGEAEFEIVIHDALELSFLPADQKEPAFDAATAQQAGSDARLVLRYRWKEKPKGKVEVTCPGILSVKTKSGTANYWFDHKYVAGVGG